MYWPPIPAEDAARRREVQKVDHPATRNRLHRWGAIRKQVQSSKWSCAGPPMWIEWPSRKSPDSFASSRRQSEDRATESDRTPEGILWAFLRPVVPDKPENVSSAGTLRHAPDDSQHTPAARHNRTQRNFRCRAGPRRPLLRSQSQHFPLVATSWESVSSQSRLSEERPTLSRKRVGGPKATGKAAGVFCL